MGELTSNVRHITAGTTRPDYSLFETTDGGTTWGRLGFGARVDRMRVVAPDLVYAVGDRAYRRTA